MVAEHHVVWSPGVSLEALEQQVIVRAYKFFRQNKTATAASLGISVKTLDNKLERYEMEEIEAEARKKQRDVDNQFQLQRARGFVNNAPMQAQVNHTNPVEVAVKHSKRK